MRRRGPRTSFAPAPLFFGGKPARLLLVCGLTALLGGCTRPASKPQPPDAETRPLRVAAAADVEPALRELAAQFQARTGRASTLTFGSTGLLAHQIQSGAPMDLFLAASQDLVEPLVLRGRIERASVRPYARGKLVMWTRAGTAPPRQISELQAPRFVRIALANPEHAPYGQAAAAALRAAGIYDAVAARLVFGDNVRQAQQFAATGNADVALTARSLALFAGTDGAFTEVPDALIEGVGPARRPGLVQVLGVVRGGDEAGAKQLADFICGPQGQAILARAGFDPPGTGAIPILAAPPLVPTTAR